MDAIKSLDERELKEIAFAKNFPEQMILKDYRVTFALYLLRNVKHCHFKGGTALQKIFLDHSRLSEDIDYTVTENLERVKTEIMAILERCGLFERLELDKNNDFFTRIVCHYIVDGRADTLFVDLNKKAQLSTAGEEHRVTHFYDGNIPAFTIKTLSRREMIAEKVAAAIGRNKPRDHFDIYQIIKRGLPIDLQLVAKKCEQSDGTFDLTKMFNKAKRLKNRWDSDMIPLLAEPITFQEVMRTLAEYFDLKGAKDAAKNAAPQRTHLKKG